MIATLDGHDFSISQSAANVRMGVPCADWSRDELDARAVWENEQIKPRQRHATHYWFLGKVLLAVGKDFDAVQWNSWREAHTINRTRCERALLIAHAFGSEREVTDLPVLAAVALAGKLLGRQSRQTTADAKLRRSLSAMKKTLQNLLDEFAQITDPTGLRPRIAELIRQLTALDHACIVLERRRRSAVSKRRREKHPK